MKRLFSPTYVLFAVCLAVLDYCPAVSAGDVTMSPHQIEDIHAILLAEGYVGQPSKSAVVYAYAERAGIHTSAMEQFLIQTARKYWASAELGTVESTLVLGAIGVLGDWRSLGAVPLVDDVITSTGHATTPSENRRMSVFRGTAIRARARIGGDDLVSFADRVVSDKHAFSPLDRFALYEELSPYIGVSAVKPVLQGETLAKDDSETSRVLQFMISAIDREDDPTNITRLDRILVLRSETYRYSDLREAVLKRVVDSRIESLRDYARDCVSWLAVVPEGQRTIIKRGVR